ncbi:MAG: hypothetical protein HZB38_02030 [Planctomycetes bacterium]|nr:hypothetical protein [Planctomycetota bacterium]
MLYAAIWVAAPALLPGASLAQYSTDFETPAFSGAASGVPLAGQDGFYVPAIDDADGACFTYADNVLGIIGNPEGGAQFAAARRISGAFSRAQHNVQLDADCWLMEFDFNVAYDGALPTQNYAGSFTLQPWAAPGTIGILFNWDDVHSAKTFTVRVLGYDADGNVPYLSGLPVADSAFRRLPANHWFRLSARLELASTNALTSLRIRDLADAAPAHTFTPQSLEGYYLAGGADPDGTASAFRIFGGGGFPGDHTSGNILAIDNLEITRAADAPCFGDLDGNGIINLQDLAYLLANFTEPGVMGYGDGDLDCDQNVDLEDLALLLMRFGEVCGG